MADDAPSGASRDRIRRLEERIAELEERLRGLEVATFKAPFKPIPEPAPRAPRRAVSPSRDPTSAVGAAGHVSPESFWPPPGRAPPATMPASAAEPARERSPRPARPARDMEQVLGANWLAKAGMVVLVLGAVFFLKFAFDQGWIPRTARVVLGVVGGLAIAGFGDWLRQRDRTRFDVYGQVLAGGGVVIASFALFAAYQFPGYRAVTGMTLELDAVLLGLLALALALYAAVRRTPLLAAEAILLAALVSRFGSDWDAFTVAYTLLFALAVSAVAVLRGWPRVLETALLASFVTFALDLTGPVAPRAVLGGATLLAVGGTVAASWRRWTPALLIATVAPPWVLALALTVDAAPREVLAATLLVAATALAATWWRRVPIVLGSTLATLAAILFARAAGLGLITTGVAIGLVGLAGLAVGAHRAWPRETHLPLAGALVSLLVGLQLGLGPWTTFGPGLALALAAVGLGAWRRMPAALVVGAFALPVLFSQTFPLGLEPIAAALALGATGVLGALLAAWRSWRVPVHAPVLAALGGVLVGLPVATTATALPAAVAIASAGIAVAAARSWPTLLATTGASAYVVLFAALAPLHDYATLAAGGVVFLALTAAATRAPPAAQPRGLWAAIAGASLLATWALALGALELRSHEPWQGPVTAGFALLGIALAAYPRPSGEVRMGWGVAGALAALAWPPVQFDGSAPISVAWTALAAVGVALLRARPHGAVKVASAAALALASLWVLTAVASDLHDDAISPLEAAFPFAFGTAVLLAAAFVATATPRTFPYEAWAPRALLGLAVALPLVYFGTALRGYGISIAWAAEGVALLVAGFVLSMRDLRFGALAVFGLTLARVFLVDFTDLGVQVRIVTFLVVGALLLLASYLYARRRAAAHPPDRNEAADGPRGKT